MDRKERSILGVIVLVVLTVVYFISNQEPAKPDCAIGCSSITYDQIYYTFIDQSHKTSAKQYTSKELEDMWVKNFQGRSIYWQGKVFDVIKSNNGQVIVNVDMGHAISYDVRLNIAKDSASRALALNKGDRISFCATMDREPGYWISMELKEVTIP